MPSEIYFCSECGTVISEVDKKYTEKHYGKVLCWNCLKRHIVSDGLDEISRKHKGFSEMFKKLQEENRRVRDVDRMFRGEDE